MKPTNLRAIQTVQTFITPVIILSLLTSCGTLKIPVYPGGPPSINAQTLNADNLDVQLDPFLDKQRMSEYFKQRPLEGGLVVLHLNITNRGSTDSFHVQKQNFRLLLPKGDQIEAAGKVDTGTASGEAAALVGASLGSFVGLFAGAKVLSDETFVRKNLVDKEMPDQTLSPGKAMQGFVYYIVPGKKPSVDGATFVFTSENAITHQKTELRFPIRDAKPAN